MLTSTTPATMSAIPTIEGSLSCSPNMTTAMIGGQHNSQSRPNGVADAQVHRDESLSQQPKAQQVAHNAPNRRQKNGEPLRSLHHERGEHLTAYAPHQHYISHLFVPFVLDFAQLLLELVEEFSHRYARPMASSPTGFAHARSLFNGAGASSCSFSC